MKLGQILEREIIYRYDGNVLWENKHCGATCHITDCLPVSDFIILLMDKLGHAGSNGNFF